MEVMNEIIAEKKRIIATKDKAIQHLKIQLAQANKLAKKQKAETIAANAKSDQLQANYEKVCSEMSELRSKFDSLASQIGEALAAKKEDENDKINVDVIEPLFALYKEKAAKLKEANRMVADLCSKQKTTLQPTKAQTSCPAVSGVAKAQKLNELTDDEQRRTVFIGGLPESFEYDDLLQHVSQFGSVQQISTPKTGGITKAFVVYETTSDFDRVQLGAKNKIKNIKCNIQRFHKTYIGNAAKYTDQYLLANKHGKDGSAMPHNISNVGHSCSKFNRKNKQQLSEAEQQRSLFVGGLAGITVPMLKGYFARFGTIVNVTVFPSGAGSGFGFVMFSSIEEAQSVPLGRKHRVNGKMVEVKLYQSEAASPVTDVISTGTFTCAVCMLEKDEICRHIFNPCGHGSCDLCAAVLTECHLCAEKIESSSRQF